MSTTQGDDDETADEGLGMSSDAEEDPIDRVSEKHVVLTQAEQAEEEESPALQDVFMTHRHLHLPGIEEVEALHRGKSPALPPPQDADAPRTGQPAHLP